MTEPAAELVTERAVMGVDELVTALRPSAAVAASEPPTRLQGVSSLPP